MCNATESNDADQKARQAQVSLIDYLTGRVRADRAEGLKMIDRANWQRLAFNEQQRRATALLEVLDDETLDAIAKGLVDIPNALELVLASD